MFSCLAAILTLRHFDLTESSRCDNVSTWKCNDEESTCGDVSQRAPVAEMAQTDT